MDYPKIDYEAKLLIIEMYDGIGYPEKGSVIVTNEGKHYKVSFIKVEEGFLTTTINEL